MSKEYEVYCASLDLEVFGGRNALRCLHFQRWFPKLRKNNSELVKALGFRDWHFTKHHANCDTEAVARAKATTRALCPMDQECKHKGYRKIYPVLDEKLGRQRKCFRILPSQSRDDITDQIEWGVRHARHLADWTPLMLLMFAEPRPVAKISRKSKRQLSNEKPAPLRWSKSMRRTLDRVELLGFAFTDDLNEWALMTELFGSLSVEAKCLRRVRDTVTLPSPERPESTSNENETPATSSGLGKTGAQFAPASEELERSPRRGKAKAKVAPVQQTEEVVVPTNTGARAEAKQNHTKKIIEMANVAHTEEIAGENGDKEPDASVIETAEIVARPKKGDIEIVIRFPRFSGDEDWLGEEDSLRPPTKRARCTPFTEPFPYTRRPDADDLAMWEESWTLFYKAQEVLKRLPGADMSKHIIPAAFTKQRMPEEGAPAPGPSQGDSCDDREEDWSEQRSANKRRTFKSMLDHRTFCQRPKNLDVDGGEEE